MNSTSQDRNFGQFLELSDPVAAKFLRLEAITNLASRTVYQAIARGASKLEQPLVLQGYMGKRLADFLWCTPVPIVCVSERVVELLRSQNLTGWSTYEVEVVDRKGDLITGYFGFSVLSDAGDIDFTHSKVLTLPSPIKGGKETRVHVGFTFDMAKWDGSDFFWVDGTRVVNQRVESLFAHNQITNVQLTHLPEVQRLSLLVEMIKRDQSAK